MESNTIIINGYDFTNEKLFGIHRNAMEIVLGIDRLLSKRDDYPTVEVAVPMGPNLPKYENIRTVALDVDKDKRFARIRWRECTFPQYLARRRAVGLDMTLGLPKHGKYCVFDYDCIIEDHAKEVYRHFSNIRRLYFMNRVKRSLKKAEIIFTDSYYAKTQIQRHYGCSEERMVVVPCAWQHMIRYAQDDGILKKYGLNKGEFFFALGSRYPYKNFRWVECAALQNPSYQFVVTGSEISFADENVERADNLLFTGYLSNEEIKGLMANCRAFLQPSLEEGFGIPPLEAMSVGADCIVSNAAALPEVYGDSVRYIDPNNYSEINMDEIMSVPISGDRESALNRYSWTRSAEIVLEAISERCFHG